MSYLYAKVYNFFTCKEDGATMVEYGLMVALIALACIAAVTGLGGSISGLFAAVDGKLDGETAKITGS